MPICWKHRKLLHLVLLARWQLARLVFFLVIFLLSPISLQAQQIRPLNPVIFLPGIMGSKLCDGQTIIWGHILNTIRRFDELELPLDPTTNRLAPCGIMDQVQVFGAFRAGIYNALLTTLADLGFRENQNLFIFPYDWRRSTLEGAVRLKEFVAQIRARYALPPDRKFNIVAHSMGGMIARIFILRHRGDQDVERLVTVATPHFGSLDAFHTLRYGMGGLENWLVGGEAAVKRAVFSFPGLIELLPTYQTCCILGEPSDSGRHPIDFLNLSFWTQFRWVPPVVLNTPGRLEFLRQAFQNAAEVKQLMETDLAHSVLHIRIVGDLLETRGQVYLQPSDGSPITWRSWGGDGTVVLQSAARGSLVLAQAVSQKHATIFQDPRVGSNLKFALTEAVEQFASHAAVAYVDVQGQRVRVASLDVRLERQYYEVGSQAEILVTLADLQGKPVMGVDLQGALFSSGETVQHPITFAASRATPAGYRGVVPVPSVVGSYRVEVHIPGLGNLEDFFVALPKP